MEQQKFIIDKDVVTLSKIRNFDWYIGVGMSKEDIMQTSTQKVTKHAIILFACFVLLIIIANSAHAFLQRRIEKRQKQYEFMLTHRSRIAQIGKLMSGINHQLRQPLNAITLIISNTLDMSERNILDKSTLEENLHLCHTSVALMDKTIDTFRNFYRCGETISEFAVKECVQGVLYVMHVDLSRSNINVVMQVQDNAHIKANSIENYIQQILLVLIQNAKDALISKIEKSGKQKIAMQTIYIDIAQQEEQIIIDVKDFGEGISATETETLFTELKSSRKNQGSGIGLYFAKKLANEKLSGDLSLIHRASPTIFRLIFSQNLISRSRTDTGLFKQGLCGNIQ
jgi:C4-dicarboxylate-specific signal transduction histidine kinase